MDRENNLPIERSQNLDASKKQLFYLFILFSLLSKGLITLLYSQSQNYFQRFVRVRYNCISISKSNVYSKNSLNNFTNILTNSMETILYYSM